MINIGIVDDQPVWSNMAYNYIKEYVDYHRADCEVTTVSDVTDVDAMERFDLLFLDIDLGTEVDGLGIARSLKERKPQERVVLLTSHGEFANKGYMVNAYRFIEKSSFDDIQEALDSFIEEKRLEERFSLPVVAAGDCEFKLSNIEYFETYGRRVKVVLVNGESIEIDLQISDIESLLAGQGFLKVQRSYVVNMSRVKTCDSRNIIMKNGMAIAIGRSNVSEVKKNIIRWKVKHS